MTRNTIGKVAERAGVGVETVRFYERKGLIKRPVTREGAYREYPDEAVNRIRFIRHAKVLGFTLREIDDLLSLRPNPRGNCDGVKKRAQQKLESVETKIESLKRIRRQLVRLTRACDRRERTAECPILESLE